MRKGLSHLKLKRKRQRYLNMNLVKFVLQKLSKETRQWENVGMTIIGRKTAYKVLTKTKLREPNNVWRVVPKVIADAYKQGWIDCFDAFECGRLSLDKSPLKVAK